MIPILNRAPDGPVGMVSPANTYVGLTHAGPGTAPGEPEKYYPTGKRNYIRLVAADDYQGASNAMLTQQLGYKKVFILNDKEAYGLGVATDYQNAAEAAQARRRRLHGVGSEGVELRGARQQDQAVGCGRRVPRRPRVRERLEADQGPPRRAREELPADRSGRVQLVRRHVKNSGGVAEGMYISVAGQPNENLGPNGKKFVTDFGSSDRHRSEPVLGVCGAVDGRVMLDGDRELRRQRAARSPTTCCKTNVTDGILGTFSINAERRHEQQPGHPVQARLRAAAASVQGDHPAAEPREGRVARSRTRRSVSGEGHLPRDAFSRRRQ